MVAAEIPRCTIAGKGKGSTDYPATYRRLSDCLATHTQMRKGHFATPMNSLKDLYVDQVQDIYSAHALEADISDDETRDASITTQYQRMCHYAIAGYGCLHAFARVA